MSKQEQFPGYTHGYYNEKEKHTIGLPHNEKQMHTHLQGFKLHTIREPIKTLRTKEFKKPQSKDYHSGGSKLQTVIFMQPTWDLDKAKEWLQMKGYKTSYRNKPHPDYKGNEIRFRQSEPRNGKYYTIDLKNGVYLVYVK